MTRGRVLPFLPTLAALAAGAGCRDSLPPLLCDQDGGCTQATVREIFQYSAKLHVDLLFVVDDTSAMAPHLDAVAAGFAEMAGYLRKLPGPDILPLSVHAGFIRAGTCDTTTRGGACGLVSPDQYMRAEWCQTITNLTGGYDETFACLGALGAADCGPAQPLGAALGFLTGPPRPGWEGFLRPEAFLMIVVVSAGDDASSMPPPEIAHRIQGLKSDRGLVAVSVIGPWSCAPGEASQGPRLLEFLQEFGANGLYLPLCTTSLAPAISRITDNCCEDRAPPCIRNVRDMDPETPGLQAACSVVDYTPRPDGSSTPAVLPSCDESAPPCWFLAPGGFCGGENFNVLRAPDWCAESGSTDVVECVVCTGPDDPACAPQTR